MKRLLKILLPTLAVIVVPLVVWRLCDNPERRKIEPLVGEWRSTRYEGLRLTIRKSNDGYRITVRRPGDARSGRTYRLHYKFCIHYTDDAGQRTDLFYTSAADALLLMPGGKTFTRITQNSNHER